MAENQTPNTQEPTDEVFVTVKLGKTGQLGVSTNSPSQIVQLGMLSMATILIAKPKESKIVKPGFMDKILPGRS